MQGWLNAVDEFEKYGKVVNLGVGGSNTPYWAKLTEEIMSYEPEIIIVMSGSNDLSSNLESTYDAPSMTVNGQTVALDSPAIIESNRTYLPVRAIANALGVSNDNIVWDSATNKATLIK